MTNRHDAPFDKTRRRLAFYSLGFFRPALRKRLRALGITLVPFGLGRDDGVIVWGRRKAAKRGIAIAARHNLPVTTVEDAFIRSLQPGWGAPPIGLTLDEIGVHYTGKSALVDLLSKPQEFDETRVRLQIDRLRAQGFSKYNAVERGYWHHRDYVLIIDQVRGDASITYGGLNEQSFTQMLADAKREYPAKEIIIRTHPAGGGHFKNETGVELLTEPANIWDVIENAHAIYVGTSQVGFEAIMAGKRPIVYGHPFYAGWGLTEDRGTQPRGLALSREELFHGAMIAFPDWFDAAGGVADFDVAIDGLEARIRARDLMRDYQFTAFKPWKRAFIRNFFPRGDKAQILRWGYRQTPDEWVCEDGFLRSRGLGAALVPPLSLVVDKTGIYFDPSRPSDLEALIKSRADLTECQAKRVEELVTRIVEAGVSKYNLEGGVTDLPTEHEIILVPGQVENDRSILLGATGAVKTNRELLDAVRKNHPDAFVIYKPHPDVEAGLRDGHIDAQSADLVYREGGLNALWPYIDRVATITSLTGFEGLLRGKAVECYGMPFYADWGLTTDVAPSTERRGQVGLNGLAYAALIDYPLYYDPIARTHSTPEIIVERLAAGEIEQPLNLRIGAAAQIAYHKIRARLGLSG